MLSPSEQLKIILKGASEVVGREELLQKLTHAAEENRPLTVKFGLDPSSPDIHLGHAVPLRKLRQLQLLGHRVVIVIGDFTARIGDPTGRSKGRVALSEETVRKNAETYCDQIFEILDREKTEVRFNSEWLAKLNFEDVIRLASTTTVARMLERDDFQNRYRNQIPIGIHEFFYPLMQAYDSVALRADLELGGTEQTFNVLMGRTLQKSAGQEPQAALFMPLLAGLDGVEKMSKSLGNYIGVQEPAEVMFKKVMEIPDGQIITYFELVTDEHPDRIEEIRAALESGANPRDIKYELASIVTALYHTPEETERAKAFYDTAFSRKAIPENIPTLSLPLNAQTLAALIPALVENGFVSSRKEFTRLLVQGGIQLNGEKLASGDVQTALQDGDVLKIGKKKFVRLMA